MTYVLILKQSSRRVVGEGQTGINDCTLGQGHLVTPAETTHVLSQVHMLA